MPLSSLVARHVVPRLLYFPAPLSAARSDPAASGLPEAREVWMRAEDGPRLHGWWVPARRGGSAGESGPSDPGDAGAGRSLVFFHGNAGNLSGRAPIADRLAERGLDVLLVDYRGYGRSEGSPSEEGLYRDGRAAWRFATEEMGRPPGRIALAGHSLGGAVAADLAASVRPGALVLTACFRNLPDLAGELYPWLPAAIFRDWPVHRLEVDRRVRRVESPVLVARGARDDLMPREHTRAVFEAAPEPKRWVEEPTRGHNDLWDSAPFLDELSTFLRDSLSG